MKVREAIGRTAAGRRASASAERLRGSMVGFVVEGKRSDDISRCCSLPDFGMKLDLRNALSSHVLICRLKRASRGEEVYTNVSTLNKSIRTF